tara:strand:+ start:752 stop:1594 length:843 start_codon:yes stop_codon:yes gene_type:complete
MIIWLASYPKSGNTWVRLFLQSYLSKNKEEFNINQKPNDDFKINRFPNNKMLKKMQIDSSNFFEIAKNWITVQEKINLNNRLNILKTHNAMCTINESKFTNKDNTSGAIYIVRDPRDIAVSFSYHLGITLSEMVDLMINEEHLISEKDFVLEKKEAGSTFLSSWSNHYNSWKNYNLSKILIIKYEDLIKKTFEKFYEIISYLNKMEKIEINEKNISNSIELTKFENLQNLEKKYGFEEKTLSKTFFREGKIGSWKQELNKDLSKKIEKYFEKEMRELNYL